MVLRKKVLQIGKVYEMYKEFRENQELYLKMQPISRDGKLERNAVLEVEEALSGKISPRSTYKKVAQLDAINEKNPAGITSAEGS